MGISEKLKETTDYYLKGVIVLYKEGVFWRAYQESCFLFVNKINQYQVLKKYYKNVGMDVVYLGFPSSATDTILHGFRSTQIDDSRLIVAVDEPIVDSDAFLAWKTPLPITEQNINKRMSYENLPVFKMTYDLLRTIYEINQAVSKEFKYSLVENTQKLLSKLLVFIFRGNIISTSEEKIGSIRNAIYCLVEVKINIRLLLDFKQITPSRYGLLAESIESISKQLVVWEDKYVKMMKRDGSL